MYRNPIFPVFLVVALFASACSFTIDIPRTRLETGPTETEAINIPLLEDPEAVADVEITFGAGRLSVEGGAEGALIEGTATYNVKEFKPQVSRSASRVQLSQGDVPGIPNIVGSIRNEWELLLGEAPMNLRITAGALDGDFDLGSLSLQNLAMTTGAGDVRVSFSQPNQTEMETLSHESGVGRARLNNLANANFASMTFKGGAGDYHLDFSGDLQRDAVVNVEAGMGNLTIVVPEGTAARLSVEGGLASVDRRGSWRSSGDGYTQPGEGPSLTFVVKMGAGNLELRNP